MGMKGYNLKAWIKEEVGDKFSLPCLTDAADVAKIIVVKHTKDI